MKSKEFKVLESRDEQGYVFFPEAFRNAYRALQIEKCGRLKNQKEDAASARFTELQLREQMAAAIGVSADAIQNWKYGNNGPGSLELLKDAAGFLKTDYKDLLHKKAEERDMTINTSIVTDYERDIARKIYYMFVDKIEEYKLKFGYSYYAFDSEIEGQEYNPDAPSPDLYCEIRKASFDIPRETIDAWLCLLAKIDPMEDPEYAPLLILGGGEDITESEDYVQEYGDSKNLGFIYSFVMKKATSFYEELYEIFDPYIKK